MPAIFYITNDGRDLAGRLCSLYPKAVTEKFTAERVRDLWPRHDSFIFVMATGIVVRTVAPLLRDKMTDPPVVVLDEKGKFAVSLLSGHLGGANLIAQEIAEFLGGEAVITTASDVCNLPSIDLWARDHDLAVENWDDVPHVATKLLNERRLNVYADFAIDLPAPFREVVDPSAADLVISNRATASCSAVVRVDSVPSSGESHRALLLRPRNLVVGVGCNSSTSAQEISDVIRKTFEAHGLSLLSVHSIATLDKKGSEPGLVKCAHDLGLRITCFTPGELNTVQGITKSDAAFRATGALAVAEPAALLASGNTVLLVPKQKIGNVTIAIAELESPEGNSRSSPGKPTQDVETRVRSSACAARDKDLAPGTESGTLYIVGTGPGGAEHITPRAVAAIRESDVIVGYGTYLDLIRDVISDKQIVSTGMTQEVARGKEAIALARTGKTVSVISGGDPGVYAMAGLIFELLRNQEAAVGHGESDLGRGSADSALTLPLQQLHVEVIPGISALNACAAKLGAPLMHDFACISLSDRLTPWELIEKRLAAASDSDFVIVLYNPKSKGRVTHIGRAREIIMSRRTQDTPVGIVKAATRQDEGIIITTLGRMLDHAIDMQTTVIIGNSQSFVWDKWMVTPRGYRV